MAELKISSRADRLLDHHRLRGHAFPAPRYWERLFQMLEEEAEKRGKTPPPAPITTLEDRMERLDEQVAWADRNNLLHRIQMFFDAMPPSAWVRIEK